MGSAGFEASWPAGGNGLTPQEQELLKQLAQRVNQTQLQEKDPDAENLLGRELGANPDAIYILAQTVLIQDIAMQQERAQISQLQQQLQQAKQQPAHATSFLGRLLGDREPQQPPPPPPQQQPPFQPVQYAPQTPPQFGAPQYGVPQYTPPMYAAPQGQSSFLRSAAQTAAGVAAGALAFEGIESLLHGFGHGGGWGPGAGMAGFGVVPGVGMGGAFERPVEETVVNNYYDQPGPLGSGEHRLDTAVDHHLPGFDGQDSATQFSDAGNHATNNEDLGSFDQGAFDPGMENASSADDNSIDNIQIDDSGSDDQVSFDDGGGFDNGGDSGF